MLDLLKMWLDGGNWNTEATELKIKPQLSRSHVHIGAVNGRVAHNHPRMTAF